MTDIRMYKYTGDVKLLKPLGYKFNKLYARNYKCYHLGQLWIFVKGGCVLEVNNLDYTLWGTVIKFILDNKDQPLAFWTRQANLPYPCTMAKYSVFNDVILSNDDIRAIKRKALDDEDLDLAFGGVRWNIKVEFVQQILLLDKLCPLEYDVKNIKED